MAVTTGTPMRRTNQEPSFSAKEQPRRGSAGVPAGAALSLDVDDTNRAGLRSKRRRRDKKIAPGGAKRNPGSGAEREPSPVGAAELLALHVMCHTRLYSLERNRSIHRGFPETRGTDRGCGNNRDRCCSSRTCAAPPGLVPLLSATPDSASLHPGLLSRRASGAYIIVPLNSRHRHAEMRRGLKSK